MTFLALIGMVLSSLGVLEASAQSRTLSVIGGPVTLVVGASTAYPGAEPAPVSSASSGLEWRTGSGGNRKITVSTDVPGQSFPLTVAAENVEGPATARPPVLLSDGMPPQDLLLNLKSAPGNESGSCTLRYTAQVSVTLGNSNTHGDDLHIVTFTLLDQ